MGVAQMLRQMDSREISEWQAFYKIEGEERRERESAARARGRAEKGFHR